MTKTARTAMRVKWDVGPAAKVLLLAAVVMVLEVLLLLFLGSNPDGVLGGSAGRVTDGFGGRAGNVMEGLWLLLEDGKEGNGVGALPMAAAKSKAIARKGDCTLARKLTTTKDLLNPSLEK